MVRLREKKKLQVRGKKNYIITVFGDVEVGRVIRYSNGFCHHGWTQETDAIITLLTGSSKDNNKQETKTKNRNGHGCRMSETTHQPWKRQQQ